ncbi:GNAT family N-acetyltransferase [Janibacter massiliensis]|uniref:GNAT family N-acetyltransferase n=1 Tax=Janibacter massiliensis TaxID=2058291 RepID=UPI0038996172
MDALHDRVRSESCDQSCDRNRRGDRLGLSPHASCGATQRGSRHGARVRTPTGCSRKDSSATAGRRQGVRWHSEAGASPPSLTGVSLTFRFAKRGDTGALQGSRCAPVAPSPSAETCWRSVYDQPWAAEAQAMIRALRPPGGRGKRPRVLLAELDGRLVGVIAWRREAIDAVHVQVGGVSLQARREHPQLRIADALMDFALERIAQETQEAGSRRVVVSALVHPNNEPSRKWCERAGFALDNEDEAVDDYLLGLLELEW